MINTSNTNYPYEHYGDISVDFGDSYWEAFAKKYIDTKQFIPIGFKFSVDNEGKFFFYIWAVPVSSQPNQNGEIPIKKFETKVTWEEFSKSFVQLNAQTFFGRKEGKDFYEIEE